MINAQNNWDKLSEYFDTHQDEDKISPGAADNILLAWPSLFRGIEQAGLNLGPDKKVLDFGCGAGLLAKKMQKLGCEVVGVDSSDGMLSKAREFVPGVDFINSDGINNLNLDDESFDLIISAMTFQFIENFEEVFKSLDSKLKVGGVFAFAIFNTDFFDKNFGNENSKFKLFQSKGGEVKMCISADTEISVYIHNEKYYDDVFLKNGYQKVFSDRPPFTPEFNEKYPDPDTNTEVPEYLILVYKKVA
jgi:SAM-dependent methyltransferase